MTNMIYSSLDKTPAQSPNAKTITITPTLATQRVLATMVLKSKLNDGWELSPNVFDWAVKTLGTSDEANDEWMETFRVLHLAITALAKALLKATADNGFVKLHIPPVSLQNKLGAIIELVKANPFLNSLYTLDEIRKLVSEEVHRLSQEETIHWAIENYGSTSALKNYHAEQIICEEMISFEKHGEWVSFLNLGWEGPNLWENTNNTH